MILLRSCYITANVTIVRATCKQVINDSFVSMCDPVKKGHLKRRCNDVQMSFFFCCLMVCLPGCIQPLMFHPLVGEAALCDALIGCGTIWFVYPVVSNR